MKLFLFLTATYLFFLTPNCFSQTTLSSAELSAVKALSADVYMQTKVLDRDIKIYSWQICRDIGDVEEAKNRYNAALKYIRNSTAAAWKESAEPRDGAELGLGDGLYAARDPLRSMEKGNCLIEVNVPKGKRYLDLSLSTSGSIKLSDETLNLLSLAGCNQSSCPKFFTEKKTGTTSVIYANYRFSIDYPVCHKIMMDTLKATDVSFIDYVWHTRAFALKDCKEGRGGAFVLLDSSYLKPQDLTVVGMIKSEETSMNAREKDLTRKMKLLSSEYEQLGSDYGDPYQIVMETRAYFFSDANHPHIQVLSPAEQQELDDWKNKYIFKCGEYPNEADLLDIDGLHPSSKDKDAVSKLVDAKFKTPEEKKTDEGLQKVDKDGSIKSVEEKDSKKKKSIFHIFQKKDSH